MKFMVKSVSDINPFLFHHQKRLEQLSMNRPYILSKNSDEEKLN